MTHRHYAQGQNVQSQEWQTGLCVCPSCENCLLSACCPCMLLGKTSERMRDPSMRTAKTVNDDCLLFCGIQSLTGCGWIYAMMKRQEIREKFSIEGSETRDCCTAYWCLGCILVQHDMEVEKRLAQGPVTQGYRSNKDGMHMPQPGQQSIAYHQQPQPSSAPQHQHHQQYDPHQPPPQ